MTTKLILPWKLRVGDRLVTFGLEGNIEINKITEIKKGIGYFTGATVWTVRTDASMFSCHTYHGKKGSLKPVRAEIVDEKATEKAQIAAQKERAQLNQEYLREQGKIELNG